MRRDLLGERGELGFVGPLASRRLGERVGEVVEAGGVEPGDDARRLVALVVAGDGGGRA